MVKLPIWINMTVAIIITTVIFKWFLFLIGHSIALVTMLVRECNPLNWKENFKEAFAAWDPTEALEHMGGFGKSLLTVLEGYGKLDEFLGNVTGAVAGVGKGIAEGVENAAEKVIE
jgi:phage-related protein